MLKCPMAAHLLKGKVVCLRDVGNAERQYVRALKIKFRGRDKPEREKKTR